MQRRVAVAKGENRLMFGRHVWMSWRPVLTVMVFAVMAFGLFESGVRADERAGQRTAAAGSPSGTTTISGKQLTPPDPKFGGVIRPDVRESKPWWPPRVVPPKDAPNVLLILTDDAG